MRDLGRGKMNRKQNILNFTKAIKNVISKFQSNPFYFFYEEDVKLYLYSQLLNLFDEEEFPIRKDFAISFGIDKIKSTPIKAEYPHRSGEISKYDISLIEAIGENHYEMPSSIAVELKLGSVKHDCWSGFVDDLRKLLMFKMISNLENKLGIAIYFYQSAFKEDEIKKWLKDFSYDFTLISIDEFTMFDDEISALIVTSESKIFSLRDISLEKSYRIFSD